MRHTMHLIGVSGLIGDCCPSRNRFVVHGTVDIGLRAVHLEVDSAGVLLRLWTVAVPRTPLIDLRQVRSAQTKRSARRPLPARSGGDRDARKRGGLQVVARILRTYCRWSFLV